MEIVYMPRPKLSKKLHSSTTNQPSMPHRYSVAHRKFFPTVLKTFQSYFGDDVCILTNFSDDLGTAPSNIVFPSDDHWGDDEFLLSDSSIRPVTNVQEVKDLADKHSNKQFYVLSVAPFLQEYFVDTSNVTVIYWGNDFLIHRETDYHGSTFVDNKEFTKEWHWVCLGNQIRMHRAVGFMLLLGLEINRGYLKFNPAFFNSHDSYDSFKSFLKYNKYTYLNSITAKFTPALRKGFDKIKNQTGYTCSEYAIENSSGPTDMANAVNGPVVSLTVYDCSGNYNKVLSQYYYKHSAIDIVLETVLISRTGILTEKYLNTVYGSNFPIIIGMQGSVDLLRKHGFDLFDDIIDHSYDTISDPYLRMTQAIVSNRDLLEDREKTIDLWNKNKSRFRSNFELIEDMYANKHKLIEEKIRSTMDHGKEEK